MTATRLADSTRLRRVEGRHNALVKTLRQAFAKAELNEHGECAIEGFRIIEEAIRSGLRFRAVFFSESSLPRVAKLLPQIGSHVETLLLPDSLFASIVSTETPQGVAALVQLKQHSFDEVLDHLSSGLVLVVVGIQDPGNLGTILRSAEAFAAGGVLLGEGTVSPYNSKVIRASAGSVFRIMLSRVKISDVITKLRERGIRLVATSSHKGTALPDANLSGATAIFIGNEGAGLDKRLLTQMDELLMIPHSERVESLNAGIAASIVLYEAHKQN